MSVLFETSGGILVLDLDYEKFARKSAIILALAYLNQWILQDFELEKDVFLKGPSTQLPEQVKDSLDKRGFEDPKSTPPALANPGSVELVEIDGAFQVQINLAAKTSQNVVGRVAEGLDVLDDINKALGVPRMLHTHVVYDPFKLQSELPKRKSEHDLSLEAVENLLRSSETQKRNASSVDALALELLGDLDHYEVKPSPETLFVARLNPITTENSLEVIFSRFGSVRKAQIRQGPKSRYAFVEFSAKSSAELAYTRLHDNCTIDGHEVLVDFSQSTKHRLQR